MAANYCIQDFSICSTGCDMLLFFASDYQRVVNECINEIVGEYESKNPGVDILDSRLTLFCYKSAIIIKRFVHIGMETKTGYVLLFDLVGIIIGTTMYLYGIKPALKKIVSKKKSTQKKKKKQKKIKLKLSKTEDI